MASFFRAFNEVYHEFLKGLVRSFGSTKKLLVLEYELVPRAIKEDADTKKIFHRIERNVRSIFTKVHKKDASIFTKPPIATDEVGLLSRTELYDIWPHLVANEQDAVWEGLGMLVQHLALICGTGKRLEGFTDLATSVIEQNPNMTQANMTETVMDQLFSNDKFAEKMDSLMQGGDLNGLRSGFGDILNGFNASKHANDMWKANESMLQSLGGQDTKTLSVFGSAEDASSSSSSSSDADCADPDMLATFREMGNAAADLDDQESKMPRKAPMEQLMEFMEQQPIDEKEEKEVIGLSAKMLGKGSTPESRESMKRMFSAVTKSNQTPESQAALEKELTAAFGASPEDIGKLRGMLGAFGGLGGAAVTNQSSGGINLENLVRMHTR